MGRRKHEHVRRYVSYIQSCSESSSCCSYGSCSYGGSYGSCSRSYGSCSRSCGSYSRSCGSYGSDCSRGGYYGKRRYYRRKRGSCGSCGPRGSYGPYGYGDYGPCGYRGSGPCGYGGCGPYGGYAYYNRLCLPYYYTQFNGPIDPCMPIGCRRCPRPYRSDRLDGYDRVDRSNPRDSSLRDSNRSKPRTDGSYLRESKPRTDGPDQGQR